MSLKSASSLFHLLNAFEELTALLPFSFFHYWAHRALHSGQLYKRIHKLQWAFASVYPVGQACSCLESHCSHEYSAPFGLAAEYAHPYVTTRNLSHYCKLILTLRRLEILILGAGTIGGPFLWCFISKGNLHILTVYIWICLRLWQAVDAHSGYGTLILLGPCTGNC